DFLDGIPELAPGFGFPGHEEGEVRLIVGVNAGHDFDVGRAFAIGVGIGQAAVPSVAEIVIAPSPLFFAGGDVVIGDMHDAILRAVGGAAEEILLIAHGPVTGRYGGVCA